MSERVVLCYGDSNTYGWIRGGFGRFARDVRWPGVLAAALGAGWHVIEEGLPGRTTVFEDPFRPGSMNGRTYLGPCLLTHEPVDLLVLFLGTNDLDPRYTVTAEEIARGVAVLAHVAAKAARLPAALRAVAEAEGLDVLELHELVAYSDVDGFHLDDGGHRAIGEAVARRVAAMF